MTPEEFLAFSEKSYKQRIKILGDPKKKRTAGTNDRFINFRRMGAAKMVPPEQVTTDLCMKQFLDIHDMLSGKHDKSGDFKYLKELIYDVQNYLDIALAICHEKVVGD